MVSKAQAAARAKFAHHARNKTNTAIGRAAASTSKPKKKTTAKKAPAKKANPFGKKAY